MKWVLLALLFLACGCVTSAVRSTGYRMLNEKNFWEYSRAGTGHFFFYETLDSLYLMKRTGMGWEKMGAVKKDY
jgi:hypothetical protein